jgi:diadenosine tetraphosphate (Ap4A) HIT family hydrolase
MQKPPQVSQEVSMSTLIHKRVEECRNGTNPKTICRVHSGWVVIGDVQFLRGYSLILPDPVVADLNRLGPGERKTLFHEMSILGDALLEITGAVRINYEILGNLEPALHVHVFPRFDTEPETLRTRPVWFYDWDNAPAFDPDRDAPVMQDIKNYLAGAGIVV